MDDKTLQTIKATFDSLPKGIQDLIMSDYYQNTLVEIGKKYGLTIEQLGIIEREVTMSLMGLTLSGNFEAELTKELGVDKEKGRNVSQEVSDRVFAKVRELLQKESGTLEEKEFVFQAVDPFKSAGIEINSPKQKIEFQPLATKSTREETLKKIETPDNVKVIGPERELPAAPQIHDQKLSGSFQIPKKESQYQGKKRAPSPRPADGPDPYRESFN
jgi:hypothetical protein